ncbi:kelch-like protein 10 [Neocloeon triangulifer]|uniref:kelch-like protein 10 n=1 Tax=Neocloeon triangulifer TaxID=2078957 RepID=UPI00286F9229|nr:kelch-like protein 10 [Neocloeon triangulifer]
MASDADPVAVSTMFQNLYKLYKESNNCDLLLLAGDGKRFNTHSFLICAAVPKLRAKIIENSKKGIMKLRVQEVKGRELELVIQFAYLGRCDLDEKDCGAVMELIRAAAYLQIDAMEKHVLRIFENSLNMELALKVHLDKSSNYLKKASPTAEKFVLRHLLDDVPSSISFEDFKALLLDDRLQASHEEKVWVAIQGWIRADPERRAACLVPLLSTLRIGFVEPDFIEKLVEHELVTHNTNALNCIHESITLAQSYHEPTEELLLGQLPTVVRPRIPHVSILAIGGWRTGEEVCAMAEVYDHIANKWTNVASLQLDGPRSYHRAEVIDGIVYVVGGSDKEHSMKTGVKLDLSTFTWRPICSMHHGRCFVSTAVMDGHLYALGGRESSEERLKAAEKYDPKTDTWTKIANTLQCHSDAAAAGLDGKVYLVGGYNGTEVMSCMECYCPETNTWTLLPPMNKPRSGLACIAHRGHLFVFGGFDGTERLSDGERYNPKTRTWTALAPMNIARSTFQIVRVGDIFYAIGGYSQKPVADVEAYDSVADKWYTLSPMLQPTSAMACAAFDNLSFSESVWTQTSRADPSISLRDFLIEYPPFHPEDEPLPEGSLGVHHPNFLEPLPMPWNDLFASESMDVSDDDGVNYEHDEHINEHLFDDSDFSSDHEDD